MRKKTSRNRRYRHDVKVLKSEVMSPRIAWFSFLGFLKSLAKIAIAFAILIGIAFGIRQAIEHTFHRNPDFQLKAIHLNTNDVLDETALVQHLNIDLNANIFDFDLDEMETKLLEIQAISSVKIDRELPGTISFHITTRKPLAWVSTHQNQGTDNRLLIDETGFAYPCPPLQKQSVENLTTIFITNHIDHPLESGKIITHPDYKYCARLLQSCQSAFPDDSSFIESITRNNEWSLNLKTRDGITATFGLAEHQRQLETFATALNHAQQKAYQIATINLIPKRNIPITLSNNIIAPRAIPVAEEDLLPPDQSRRNQDLQSLLKRN